MQFEAKLTLDGLMTLVVGLIAFAAVIFQIRSSSKQVQDQIKAQRDAEREEQERQRRATATAILFEIDNFYRHHLGQVRDFLTLFERSNQLPGTVPASAHGFVVYHGNASRLGDLPRELAGKIVRFYGTAEHYNVVREDYRARLEREAPQDQGVLQTQFRQLKNLISKLELCAYELSKEFCPYLDLPFDPSVVEIAGTDIKTLEAEVPALDRLEAAAVQQISAYAKKN
jgi:hypothetical protein